ELAQSANSPGHTFKLTWDELVVDSAATCVVQEQKATTAINKPLHAAIVIIFLQLKMNLDIFSDHKNKPSKPSIILTS
ncbi:MAG: hypothetical protein ACOYLM_12960, partial [Methylococcaceae bacterium]